MDLPSHLKNQNKTTDLQLCQLYCLREFPGHGTGRKNWRGARWTSWVTEIELTIQEKHSRQNLQDRVLKRRELSREHSGNLQKGPWVFGKIFLSGWMSGNYPRLGEEPPTVIRGSVPGAYTRLGIMPAPTRWENIIIYRTWRTVLGKVLPQ